MRCLVCVAPRWASVWHRQWSRYHVSSVAGTVSALYNHLQHVRDDDAIQRDQCAQDSRTTKRLRRTQPQSAFHRHLDYYVLCTGLHVFETDKKLQNTWPTFNKHISRKPKPRVWKIICNPTPFFPFFLFFAFLLLLFHFLSFLFLYIYFVIFLFSFFFSLSCSHLCVFFLSFSL